MAIITDKQMQARPGSKDKWLTEDAAKGHGRFLGRITKGGDRLFYFRYTGPEGVRVTWPIGKYDPKGRDGFKLSDARVKAGELSRLYQSGVTDIKGHFEAEKRIATAKLLAEEARLESERLAYSREQESLAAKLTVQSLFERWCSVDLVRRKDQGAEVKRIFEKDVLPKIGSMAVEDVRKGHITEITDSLLSRKVNRLAKLVFSLIRQMFRFAVDRDVLEFDPTATIRKAKIGGPPVERDRVLSEDEIALLAQQLPHSGVKESTEIAVLIALATCCRIGELMAAKWDHVDFDRGVWVIPSENSKNGREHLVYLSTVASQAFRRLKNIAEQNLVKRQKREPEAQLSAWVYPNRSGKGQVCPKTVTKQLSDRQRPGEDPMSCRAKAVFCDKLVLPRGKWTPHDLRRTGATIMVSLGVLPEVAERCLNHVEQNRIKRIYQRHGYESEMREAWRLLGDRLELLMKNDEGSRAT